MSAVEGAMVLIQLLLPTSGAASADGLAPLAETRRELADRSTLAERFHQEKMHVRAVTVEMLDEDQI